MQLRTLMIFALGFLLGALVTAGLGGVYFNTRLQLERARADAARAEAERQRDQADQARIQAQENEHRAEEGPRAAMDGFEEQLKKVGEAMRQQPPPQKPKEQP